MKPLKNLLAVAAGFFLLVGCNAERESIPAEELYYRNFIKKYGLIDTGHNWSLATNQNITVKGAPGKDVKIYADFSGKRHLVADYSAIDDNATLTFDVPAEVKTVIARVGATNYKVNIGETLNASGSRVVPGSSIDGFSAELITNPDHWMVVPMLNATMFRSKMPENCYNANRDGVTVDFTMKFTEHDIVVRPLYWQTNQTLSFGLFYLDENNQPVHLPVYEMEKTDEYNDNSVLGWAPAPVKTVMIEDYMNNEAFRQFMVNEGIEIENLKDPWNADKNADLPVLTATDNFDGRCTSLDDRRMTRACRAYLESLGYVNSKSADPDKRYNYVYRWRMIGDQVLQINYPNPDYQYEYLYYKKNLEITFTHYECDTDQAKAFGSKDDMLGDMGGIEKGDGNYPLRKYEKLGYPAVICKGIKVHLDNIDRVYGAYIRNQDGYKYSMSALNPGKRWIPKPDAQRSVIADDYQTGTKVHKYNVSDFMIDEDGHAYRAATWKGTKYGWRYMCFEDGVIPETEYNSSSCDFDMQDFVFIIDNFTPGSENPPVIIEDKEDPEPTPVPVKWTVAVEDLGETDDYDFNDLVLSIEYVSGQSTATIKALAAGGIYPIYVKYRGELIDPRHVNAWFGETDDTKMINTYRIDHTHENGITIEVDPKSSINDIFKDLTIMVYGVDETDGGKKVIEITHHRDVENHPDNCGDAPLMILVKDDWEWPVERFDIMECYPHFKDWVGDKTITDWYDGKNSTVRRD